MNSLTFRVGWHTLIIALECYDYSAHLRLANFDSDRCPSNAQLNHQMMALSHDL